MNVKNLYRYFVLVLSNRPPIVCDSSFRLLMVNSFFVRRDTLVYLALLFFLLRTRYVCFFFVLLSCFIVDLELFLPPSLPFSLPYSLFGLCLRWISFLSLIFVLFLSVLDVYVNIYVYAKYGPALLSSSSPSTDSLFDQLGSAILQTYASLFRALSSRTGDDGMQHPRVTLSILRVWFPIYIYHSLFFLLFLYVFMNEYIFLRCPLPHCSRSLFVPIRFFWLSFSTLHTDW